MKMPPINVVHGVHWPRSGIVSLLKNMLPLFDSKKFVHHVIFFEHDEQTMENFSKICESVHSLFFSSSKLKAIVKYYKLLQQISPDILHTHSFQPGLWGRIFLRTKAKFICTIHNMYPYFTSSDLKSLIKRILESYSIRYHKVTVVCVSDEVKKLVETIIPKCCVKVIQNGIAIGNWNTHNIKRDTLNLKGSQIILVTLGRLDYQKGYDILLKAFAKVTAQISNTRLIIIGDGNERKKLEKMAIKLGIAEEVTFTGYQSNPFPYLVVSDIYVCSSRYEGFGLSIAEGMLFGLPVIATRIGGIPSLIQNGETGLLVAPENTEKLADSILRLIKDENLRHKIGQKGKLFIQKHFDIKKTVKKYEETYIDLISNSKGI